jgi:hypothetical protein
MAAASIDDPVIMEMKVVSLKDCNLRVYGGTLKTGEYASLPYVPYTMPNACGTSHFGSCHYNIKK